MGADRAAAARAVVGALLIATSALLVHQAAVSVSTAAAARCLYAFPILALLAIISSKRRAGGLGMPSRKHALWAGGSGVFFAIDLLLWHTSIAAVGTGLATTLANCQVAIVGLVAWVVLGERPTRGQLIAIPIVMVGVVAIGGLFGGAAFGDRPVLGAITGAGTGVAYTGFLLSLRAATPEGASPTGALAISSLVSGLFAIGAGLVLPGTVGAIDFVPAGESQLWLITLAIGCQVIAWILIARSLARLPAIVVSLILPLQPVGSLILGTIILSERPGALQWGGVVLVVVGMGVASMRLSHTNDKTQAEL